ncbi:heat shock protein transcriptional repressor HspR [Ancrocorticia populi]|uniref:heat shock protein transcriptional repressor HspR n=1 Tax=Ancrocorticia populi TaxID=2175228 RepID=UPI003F98FE8D
MAIAGRDAAILTVSVAAELAGMHPQTVRQYDRMGLVPAKRTRGGGRRYSLADVDKLVTIQELSQNEGINLVGISRIFALQRENDQLRQQNSRLRKRAKNLQERVDQRKMLDQRVFAADVDGDVTLFARAAELRERMVGRDFGHSSAAGAAGTRDNGKAGGTASGSDVIFPRAAEIVIWRPPRV